MTKQDFYLVYQSNLKLLEREIDLAKKSVQQLLGKRMWVQQNRPDVTVLSSIDFDILAGTRLLSFLVSSWLEARLMKILFENSSVAFSTHEISIIRNLKTINDKWRACFYMSLCKSYGLVYIPGKKNYSRSFAANSRAKDNYLDVVSFFNDIDEAITVRNRLAHGQWSTQLNSESSKITSLPFLAKYDNIQKLGFLIQSYKIVAEIISAYATRKDKSTSAFDSAIFSLIKKLKVTRQRIDVAVFDKYCVPFARVESKKREMEANAKHIPL